MWISRVEYEALRKETAELRITNIALERALAQSQANVDWLRTQFNIMSNDRAAISLMKFGTALPAPQLDGPLRTPEDVKRAAAAAPGTVGAPAAAEPAGLVAALEEEDDLDRALERYQGMAGGLDDIGDDAAAKMGIGHADDGTVEYKR